MAVISNEDRELETFGSYSLHFSTNSSKRLASLPLIQLSLVICEIKSAPFFIFIMSKDSIRQPFHRSLQICCMQLLWCQDMPQMD